MMLKVLDESAKNAFLKNSKGEAANRNAVEIKCNLQFPKQLLYLFSADGKQAAVQKVSCIHMFESAP